MTDSSLLAPPPVEWTCPKCQTRWQLLAPEQSTHYACPECQNYFKLTSGHATTVLGRFTRGADFVRQVLPLGATATLPDGRRYQVVGFSARAEAKSLDYRWGEYQLFSPPHHHAQLAVYEGHWTFIRPDKRPHKVLRPNTREATVQADGRTYELYNKYSPRIHHAAGEFDWNILKDQELTVQEFIAPPFMLTREQGKGQAPEWFRAEHMEPAEVAAAFSIPRSSLPDRSGVGAIQTAPGEKGWTALLYFSFGLTVLALLLQIGLAWVRPARTLFSETYTSQPAAGSAPGASQSAVIVTPAFELKNPAALYFQLWAGVDNQWLELPVSLVEERTGRGYEFTKTFEYYHGYEDGENWSEGSPDADATLTGIPAGRYHLNLYPQSENAQPISLRVSVAEHPTLESNLLLLLLAVLAFPIGQFVRRRLHEQIRWTNSDYGPNN